jgi:hypothetical protein
MAGRASQPGEAAPAQHEQLWFFLTEGVKDDKFKQGSATLAKVMEMDLTLQQCIKCSGTKGKAEEYSFWIHSQSMKAAVQLLTDESIIGTYRLYCSKDPVIQIICRQSNDPSPNSSLSPSYKLSLAIRQKESARRGLLAPELFTQPKIRHVSGSTGLETYDEIKDEDQMVSIDKDGETFTFTHDYLKGKSCYKDE